MSALNHPYVCICFELLFSIIAHNRQFKIELTTSSTEISFFAIWFLFLNYWKNVYGSLVVRYVIHWHAWCALDYQMIHNRKSIIINVINVNDANSKPNIKYKASIHEFIKWNHKLDFDGLGSQVGVVSNIVIIVNSPYKVNLRRGIHLYVISALYISDHWVHSKHVRQCSLFTCFLFAFCTYFPIGFHVPLNYMWMGFFNSFAEIYVYCNCVE